jgi:hypothetical protein
LTWASCSAFSAEARASAAATSMSCALAGLAIGPGVGPGRTGGLGRIAPGPGAGAGDDGAALGVLSVAGAVGRRGGAGRALVGALGALGAAAAGAGALPFVSRAPRSRRATGASTVLDADLTNSPISLSLARTVLLSTPSSLASSCTRAFPGTALLTSRSCRQNPQRPHSCTRSLFISGTSSCAHVGRPTLLGRGWAPTPHHRWLRAVDKPLGCARPADRCQQHRRVAAPARRLGAAPPARSKPDRDADELPAPAVGGPDRAGAGGHPRSRPRRTATMRRPERVNDSRHRCVSVRPPTSLPLRLRLRVCGQLPASAASRSETPEGSLSGLISIRQPVSRAASRAF